MTNKRKTRKRSNPVAKDVRTAKYRMRVVISKKVYNRKRKYVNATDEV